MSINSSFFMSDFNFDVTVKSLLLGFSRKENVKVTGCVNVVVFGTTEASASAYVSNLLKGATPENIRCSGVDTKPATVRGKGFSGYIVMLPELRFLGAEHFDKITDVIEVYQYANQGQMDNHEYKDLEILFGNRDIEGAFFGSEFEKWKTDRENTRGWHIYGEHVKYSRARFGGRPTIAAKGQYLGEESLDIGDEAAAAGRQAEPYVLSWTKVAALLLAKDRRHAVVDPHDTHAVRFDEQFTAMSPQMLYSAIGKFAAPDTLQTPDTVKRIVCIHDSLARMLFEDSVKPDLAIGDQFACCTESGDAEGKPTRIVVELKALVD